MKFSIGDEHQTNINVNCY